MKTKKNFSDNYIVKFGWMIEITENRYEADILAIIHGFSQDGEGEFTGSLSYLANWLQCGRSTIITHLKNLVDRGILIKSSQTLNNITFNRYKVDLVCIQNLRNTGTRDERGGTRDERGGGTRDEPNNTRKKEIKKEIEESSSPISFFETKQAITKHLNKAIKKKEWLDLTDGLDKDVPTIIEEVADAWIGKDRPFNPNSISNQKGVITFARSWCENLPRHISKQSENKETIISEKSLNNNPDAIYEFIETTRNRKMTEGEKDYCRPIVENLLKKGVLRLDKFQDEYPEMIKHIPKAKNLTSLFEGYERFVTYIQ